MIKIFRNIRKQFIREGKAGSYAKYALGEIALVVIGILIALQINNWNEKNTANNINKIYLTSLVDEIVSNTQLLKGSLKETQESMKISNYYLTIFNQKDMSQVQDSSITNMMNNLGNILSFSPTQSTIDDLLNSGALKSLKDQQLKKQILEVKFVYEGFKQLSIGYEKARDTYLIPYFIKNANLTKVSDSLSFLKIPKIETSSSKTAFVRNREFNNILFTMEVINARNERQFISWIKYLEQLSLSIEKHLEND